MRALGICPERDCSGAGLLFCTRNIQSSSPIRENSIYGMSYSFYRWNGNKKEGDENPALVTVRIKELELDEQPRPCGKVCHSYTPVPDSAEPSAHDRIRGRRKIKA
jgi:hypothetical protein